MPTFKISLQREVEAPTLIDALRQAFTPNQRSGAVIEVANFPQVGFVRMPGESAAVWDDRAKAKALRFNVYNAGGSYYIERCGVPSGNARIFNDWHMDEEAAWLAVIRHVKRTYPDAWKALG